MDGTFCSFSNFLCIMCFDCKLISCFLVEVAYKVCKAVSIQYNHKYLLNCFRFFRTPAGKFARLEQLRIHSYILYSAASGNVLLYITASASLIPNWFISTLFAPRAWINCSEHFQPDSMIKSRSEARENWICSEIFRENIYCAHWNTPRGSELIEKSLQTIGTIQSRSK